QHAGVPAEPIVAPGERVRKGQKVADVPADKLGAPIHAPIDGVVVSISPNIMIKR
ncbi:electron transport complex protein RnfC, partial [bacterium]